jgi:UDP-N-acetylmuramyl pentapeptide phosphotransferase/UDP-N-acetylglucosamine-1-phosphate transferase
MIMKFCEEKNLYDIPDARKVHKKAIPRLGGISFLPSMLLASLVAVIMLNHNFQGNAISLSTWSITFFISLLLIYGIGIVDDLVGLGAKTKFSVQIIAATIFPFSGLYINNLYGFCGIHEIPFYIGSALTVFIIVFVCNAINLIDGIDGLSAGISLIALSGFLVCFFREGIIVYSILIAGLIGILIPFLYFNIFGKAENNRKIFMGDSGSLTLGFILGFLFVKFTMDNPNVKHFRIESMMLAYSLLIVPSFDVVRVSMVRLFHKAHIFQADKNHIHHKLMRTGMNQHQALICIMTITLAFILTNLVLWYLIKINMSCVVVIDIVIWMLLHWCINKSITKRGLPVYMPNQETA